MCIRDRYSICEYARSITLERPALLGRIIARPYVGEPGNFTRTSNRRDLAVSPFAPTVLDKLNEAGIDTYAVGKINDIFNGAGINLSLIHIYIKLFMKSTEQLLVNSFIYFATKRV